MKTFLFFASTIKVVIDKKSTCLERKRGGPNIQYNERTCNCSVGNRMS